MDLTEDVRAVYTARIAELEKEVAVLRATPARVKAIRERDALRATVEQTRQAFTRYRKDRDYLALEDALDAALADPKEEGGWVR
jgi:hypothetical protein